MPFPMSGQNLGNGYQERACCVGAAGRRQPLERCGYEKTTGDGDSLTPLP